MNEEARGPGDSLYSIPPGAPAGARERSREAASRGRRRTRPARGPRPAVWLGGRVGMHESDLEEYLIADLV